MSRQALATDTTAVAREANAIALRRKGEAEEVAKGFYYLLSDDSSYISGQVHSIDGGWFC